MVVGEMVNVTKCLTMKSIALMVETANISMESCQNVTMRVIISRIKHFLKMSINRQCSCMNDSLFFRSITIMEIRWQYIKK